MKNLQKKYFDSHWPCSFLLPKIFQQLIIFFICLFFLPTIYAETFLDAKQNFAKNPDVLAFIDSMVTKHQFKKSTLLSIFKSIKIRPKVIQNVRSPLEQRPWYTYRLLYVTEQRITQGVAFWNKYQDVLAKAEKIYGVPANIIVATIGIESRYGQSTGEFRVIDALVNLAFGDTSRTLFFRKELEEFLLLAREQHLDPLTVMGSYAGAIGQPQFMPSSYRNYAVNFSGNPSIDLSHDEVDVIGSIANYYKKNGWQKDQPIATPISLARQRFQLDLTRPKNISLSRLIEYGMVPDAEHMQKEKFKLIVLKGNYRNEYWKGFHNFDVIKRYNHSELYAMAVYQLSYYLAVLRGE